MWRIAGYCCGSSLLSYTIPALSRTRRTLQQTCQKRGIKSLGINLFFRHPDSEVSTSDYEDFIKSTAFLVAVDAPHYSSGISTELYHRLLEESTAAATATSCSKRREEQQLDRIDVHSKILQGSDGSKRSLSELRWLEFLPQEKRPNVHVITCRHVLAPWLYYPHPYDNEILEFIRAEHCMYFLEVFDSEKPGEPALARFDVNQEHILHSSGLDVAITHLKNESMALSQLKELGVETLHLREDVSNEKTLTQEELVIDGYKVDEDRRFFHGQSKGTITGFADHRFFMKTPTTLHEGFCGAPVLDQHGRVVGSVEGIAADKQTYQYNQQLIGQACVVSLRPIAQFVDWSERQLLKQIAPKVLFDRIVEIKSASGTR